MRSTIITRGLILVVLGVSSGCKSSAGTNQTGSGAKQGDAGGSTAANGGSGTGGMPVLPSQSLTLKSATAHVDGRRGNRVRVSINGEQTAGTFASVAVTALDSNNSGLAWFDADHDGTQESSTGYLVPQVIPNETSFNFDILVPITSALRNWSQAKISLFDRTDAVSNELSVAVEQQPERASGQACDPAAKTDRCAQGFECSAASSTCVRHTGPSLSQVAYVTTTNGPMLLAAGTDNADDVIEMKLGFQDSKGAAVLVNVTNDDKAQQVATLTTTDGYSITDGAFLFHVDPAATFSQAVNKVTFATVDAQSHSSTISTGTLGPATSRGSGSTCDYRGFNYCSGASACYPGTPSGKNTCQPVGAVQPSLCKVAPVIDPTSTSLVITGYNVGSSIWEPPAACVTDNGFGHPETVVKLHLPAAATLLTVTTDRRETHMDTVVYVASACGASATQVLGCNDDTSFGNVTSTLALPGVVAGDYYIIVDSMSNDGGPFGLTVTTQ